MKKRILACLSIAAALAFSTWAYAHHSLAATYQRDVGFPGVASFPVDYEASIETPVSQFVDP